MYGVGQLNHSTLAITKQIQKQNILFLQNTMLTAGKVTKYLTFYNIFQKLALKKQTAE